MRCTGKLFAAAIVLLTLPGCATLDRGLPSEQQASGVTYANPLCVPATDHDFVWETTVNVLGNYFRVKDEQPVRVFGDTLTEGRIDTFPEVASTLLEPWRSDSANTYAQLESTLQSMRRYAIVRVIPVPAGGFSIDVAVYKELENAAQPMMALTGTGTFNTTGPMTRVVNPIVDQDAHLNWIQKGRDAALEQRILGHLQYRLSTPSTRVLGIPWQFGQTGPVQPAGGNGTLGGPQLHMVARQPLDSPGGQPAGLSAATSPPPSASPPNATLAPPVFAPTTAGPPAIETFQPATPAFLSDGVPPPDAAGYGLLPSAADNPIAPLLDPWVVSPPLAQFASEVEGDYLNFYSCTGLELLGGGLGVAAVLANTTMDQQVRDYYQQRLRSGQTDGVASVFKQFGEGEYTIPLVAAAAVIGPAFDTPAGDAVGQWGNRSLRSVIVGGPLLLALQYGLGPARPSADSPYTSHWEPFVSDHGASGHAFIGAIPFLNAAAMSDDFLVRAGLITLSVMPGLSRINDDQHYLSQVVLGYWLAVLSTVAVDHTDADRRQVFVVPLADAGTVGLGLMAVR